MLCVRVYIAVDQTPYMLHTHTHKNRNSQLIIFSGLPQAFVKLKRETESSAATLKQYRTLKNNCRIYSGTGYVCMCVCADIWNVILSCIQLTYTHTTSVLPIPTPNLPTIWSSISFATVHCSIWLFCIRCNARNCAMFTNVWHSDWMKPTTALDKAQNNWTKKRNLLTWSPSSQTGQKHRQQ